MPCNSDYMNPTDREREAHQAAQLLSYVYTLEGSPLPEWLQAAAKNEYGETSDGKEHDIIGVLCDHLRAMDTARRDTLLYSDPRSRPRRRLADWWERHLEHDAERARLEKESAALARIRATAIAKLSPEERKALGL